MSLSWLWDWLGRCSRDIGVELELTLDREAMEPDGEVVLLPGTPQDVAVAAGPVPRVWVDRRLEAAAANDAAEGESL